MITRAFFSLSLLFIILSQPASAGPTRIIQTGEVVILAEDPLVSAAEEVVEIYGGLKAELEGTLGWRVDFRPTVLLIIHRKKFVEMAGTSLIVAFAVPDRKLVVIDYSQVTRHPFSLRSILKHELCHLLLHRHVEDANLPKWLDEGVSQWVSEGVAEIIMGKKQVKLRDAILSGNYIPLEALEKGFPRDEKSLVLAYEESKSLIEFIDSEFGREGILRILERLKEGDEVNVAIQKALSIGLVELEGRWHHHLRKRTTWFTYISTNLYGILFFLAALITIWGFVRAIIRKRKYEDERDDQPVDK